MKYSIDYIEELKGYEIVKALEKVIEEAKEDFRYGNYTYDEMLYKIGEKAKLVGCALSDENRYADKSETEDMYVDDDRVEQEIRDWVNY